ncbi:MAG: hypothetical protein ACKPKO_20835, partial [Candidatus Fonsibacter sp.]
LASPPLPPLVVAPPGTPRPPSHPPPGSKPLASASAGVEEVSSAARSSTDLAPTSLVPDPSGKLVSHLRRGPPCVPRVLEDLAIQRLPNETDEEFKVRCTKLRYASVEGLTELECEMIDFL